MKIITTRTRDSRLFHKLVNKQRGHGRNIIEDFQVGDTTFNRENQILQGFKEHFESLANVSANATSYHVQVDNEFQSNREIVKETNIEQISLDELKKAVSQINTGKSADHYGLTIENVLYAGESAMEFLLSAVNIIFKTVEIPDGLKLDF